MKAGLAIALVVLIGFVSGEVTRIVIKETRPSRSHREPKPRKPQRYRSVEYEDSEEDVAPPPPKPKKKHSKPKASKPHWSPLVESGAQRQHATNPYKTPRQALKKPKNQSYEVYENVQDTQGFTPFENFQVLAPSQGFNDVNLFESESLKSIKVEEPPPPRVKKNRKRTKRVRNYH